MIVLASPSCAEIVGAYADAGAFLALIIAASGTAAKYLNRNNRPRATTSS
ncbi:hypothetical protein [Streptomyces sp. NPDC016626]